ncbi:MAG: UrcA family protein [Sphingomonadaceae bacterium]|nr:UrcA family protein [Sphingomonadaceae bacterium]
MPGLVALSLSAAAAAAASDGRQVVSYADLDLRRPAGQAMLDRRLHAAIRRVCGVDAPSGAAAALARRRCLSDARLSAERGRSLAMLSAGPPPVEFAAVAP